MFRLSGGEEIMTLAFFVLIQYRSVTDGQTDGHLCFGYTSACIACYANALVKSNDTNTLHVNNELFSSVDQCQQKNNFSEHEKICPVCICKISKWSFEPSIFIRSSRSTELWSQFM